MALCELHENMYTACMQLLHQGRPAAELQLHVCNLGLHLHVDDSKHDMRSRMYNRYHISLAADADRRRHAKQTFSPGC